MTEAEIIAAERDATIHWLRRRARMCLEDKKWWRPFRNRRLRHYAGAFSAAASSIKNGAHLAQTLGAETEVFRQALQERGE